MSYCRLLCRTLIEKSKRWNYLKKYSCYSSVAIRPSIKYEPGSRILGYTVKEISDIPELNITAVSLEHEATGASHLHLAAEDSNNLMGVGLKTIAQNDTGAPHILEHLALCGSRKYPCKDPFMNMLSRSLATFMNAFTGSDFTFYGFSTPNPKDFQNLMSVYLDAVFFPALSEKDFMQEGWRLEHENIHDKNSPIIFKGVVFNEMKGVFSDPNQYYGMKVQNMLFPTNTYSCNFGGDPLVIPSLTWDELKQFHARHYHPSNSRFITYGDLPLELNLENIEENVLQHFCKINLDNEIPDEKRWSEPKEVQIYNRFDPMAAMPEKQTIISNTYLLERVTDTYENFALSILSNLLIDGPNAPFYQSLLESGIAPDYSPYAGFENNLKQSVFSIGAREIAKSDVDQVKEVIESTFNNVIDTGFPDERIKSILHSVELGIKHRTSNFGLNCAMGVNSVWNHGGNPVKAFKINDHVNWFLNKMKENPHFLQEKVVQHFKENKHKLTVIMSPVENFEQELQAKERSLLKTRISKLTDEDKLKIYDDGLLLEKHQENMNVSCLPTLLISDVERNLEKTQLVFNSHGNVNIQLCEQPTNEIVYFNALVDAASVPEEYVMLLPLFCSIATQMGAGQRNYRELDQEIQLKTNGLNVSFHASEHPSNQTEFENGIHFSSYCLEKNVSDMFSLWKDIFNKIHLDDQARLSQLIKLNATELAQSITYRGHIYSMRSASSALSHCANLKERTSGLSQITFMKKLAAMDDHIEILKQMKDLSTYLLQKSKMRCALNAVPSAMPTAVKELEDFLNSLPVNSVPGIRKSSNSSDTLKTHFVLPLSVNYVGQSILTVPYCHKDYASLMVGTKLISTKFLHKEIREKGGAYGGGAVLSKGGLFSYYSYRDPNVSKTLDSFNASIDWLVQANHSEQDINEAKLSVFREIDAPITPGSKGLLYFQERISDEMKQDLRERIFECKKEDIISVCTMYMKNPYCKGIALIGPQSDVTRDNSTGWKLVIE